MSQLFQDTNIYLIIHLMPIADDIKYKILMLLLGMTKTPSADRICHAFKTRINLPLMHVSGLRFEVNAKPNSLREAIISEIRIVQFDEAVANKERIIPAAEENIQIYKELLAKRFVRRYIALFWSDCILD